YPHPVAAFRARALGRHHAVPHAQPHRAHLARVRRVDGGGPAPLPRLRPAAFDAGAEQLPPAGRAAAAAGAVAALRARLRTRGRAGHRALRPSAAAPYRPRPAPPLNPRRTLVQRPHPGRGRAAPPPRTRGKGARQAFSERLTRGRPAPGCDRARQAATTSISMFAETSGCRRTETVCRPRLLIGL